MAAELFAAVAQVLAVVLVAPSDLSASFSLALIVSGVMPGLLLTGDIKLLNIGNLRSSRTLIIKTGISTAINIPLTAILVIAYDPVLHPPILLFAVSAFAIIGSTAQAFSSTWYYVQTDKFKLALSKGVSLGLRAVFASGAIWFSELTLALIGMSIGAIAELIINFQSLPQHVNPKSLDRRDIVSPLGIAYGFSRVVSAGAKLGLSDFFGPLIASFLLIEQLVGGANSIFEKYFMRSATNLSHIRVLKVAYIVGMLGFVPWMASHSLLLDSKFSLFLLLIVACSGLLPLSDMYDALQKRGQLHVAIGSSVISILFSILLGWGWLVGELSWISLIAYIASPSLTFLFYWISARHARNNNQ